MSPEKMNELVERVRVACFEAPKAHSHTEWKRRIEAILDDAAAPDPLVVTSVTLEGRVTEHVIPYSEHPITLHSNHPLSCDCVWCE